MKYGVLEVNQIYIDGNNVTIMQSVKDGLDNIYTPSLMTEVPVCLAGTITNDGIVLFELEQAVIVYSNSTSVEYITCPTYIGSYRVLGTMHNHPSGECRLSTQDIETYTNDMTRGQEIIGLKCSQGYVFYILSFLYSEVK